ncbi:LLM class flavin-dependent oxidoreductase [Actinopolyspora erythraea]|uniref:LLM class flavin-dependent oxidoreductase n=1 Tax=Actinopolyspora erythraea TaxID=414996 RepID=A0A099DA05_9ACTN|nr:LLM class flavin-dependent oxidoreductase [Actinopolyspora erythraea]ASU80413.1 LLM class flavin-dependent oxidoreductase [Actinopolyspora erythraea]KGI82914.1 monooxygenase [Actinopolyspora erythraea]
MYTGFGAFLSPLHQPGQDPHLTIRRDLRLVEQLDELNFDECWFGEHHSLGWPTIGAPETMIAAAAERTSQIKLANGVVTLPFHHPFHVATRATLLDHLTRGRYILGVGPGATPNDARILGIDMDELKRMSHEALPNVIELVNGEQAVDDKTDWYSLNDAKMQLPRYSRPGIEMAISSAGSPNGPRVAGTYGMSLLSFGAPPPGFPAVDLAQQWRYAEEAAEENGRTIDRKDWRVAVPLYIAETREQAYEDAREGFDKWLHGYWGEAAGFDVSMEGVDRSRELEAMVERGRAIVGSVEDAIAGIEHLQETTGGFGTFLTYVVNWASHDKTRRSFELLAEEVAPHFTGTARRGIESIERSVASREPAA